MNFGLTTMFDTLLPKSEIFVDPLFWIYFAGAAALCRLVRGTGALQAALLVSNLALLLSLPRFETWMLAVVALLAAGSYGLGILLIRTSGAPGSRGRWSIATIGVVAVVATLAVFKYAQVQRPLFGLFVDSNSAVDRLIPLIGISYIAFKAIHFLLEAYKGTIKEASFLTYLNYLLFFPAFVSGPINRFPQFAENTAMGRKAGFLADLRPGIERIISGLFKKTVLTVVLFPFTIKGLDVPLETMPAWQVLGSMYVYGLYIYFDFSGYTDLAIGSARLLGFALPENFNQPLLKRNIQQLWANWHMSLTSWLTDYIYWPLVRRLRNYDWMRKHPILLSNIAIIFTFALCGIWHGDTWTFVAWGLYHGFGIAAVNTYQNWKRKQRHPGLRRYFTSPISHWSGTVATFTFFALGLLPFALSPAEMGIVVRSFLP